MAINTGAGSGGVGFVQNTTWLTAVAVGAGRQIRALSFDDSGGGVGELTTEEISNANGSASHIGGELRRVRMTGYCYYGSNVAELLAYIFGTSGAPTNNTGSYTHTLTWTDLLTKFMTLVVGKRASQKPWEYASVMARRLVIRGQGQGRLEWEMELIGGALDTDSSTNTTTELAALTIPNSTRPAVRLTDGVLRINAQAGAALQSSDAVTALGFELVMERPMAEDFGTGSAVILQPAEDGENMVTLAVDLRSYDAETWLNAWETGTSGVPTEYKADLTFSSGVTPTSGNELTWTFSFPRMYVKGSPTAPVGGPQRISHRVLFHCLEAASAPTGMTGITKPVHLVVEDEDSSAYLA